MQTSLTTYEEVLILQAGLWAHSHERKAPRASRRHSMAWLRRHKKAHPFHVLGVDLFALAGGAHPLTLNIHSHSLTCLSASPQLITHMSSTICLSSGNSSNHDVEWYKGVPAHSGSQSMVLHCNMNALTHTNPCLASTWQSGAPEENTEYFVSLGQSRKSAVEKTIDDNC